MENSAENRKQVQQAINVVQQCASLNNIKSDILLCALRTIVAGLIPPSPCDEELEITVGKIRKIYEWLKTHP